MPIISSILRIRRCESRPEEQRERSCRNSLRSPTPHPSLIGSLCCVGQNLNLLAPKILFQKLLLVEGHIGPQLKTPTSALASNEYNGCIQII